MQITPKAAEKIREFLFREDPDKVFRVSVATGGCSGFSYKTEIGASQPAVDQVIEVPQTHGRVVTTIQSATLLENVVLDYEETLGHSGFTFNNPDASSTCGCGMSFDF